MNLNKVFILGNLTRDPEKRSLPSGQTVVSLGVATNRFFKGQDNLKKQDTEFHNVILFGRLADIAAQYLQKGGLVFIEGRLKTRNWQDAQGTKHSRTEIIAENMQLGPRLSSLQAGPSFTNQSKNEIKKPAIEDIPVIEEPQKENEEINIEDIPF